MIPDDLLGEAARDLRDRTDGTVSDPGRSRERILVLTVRRRRRRQRLAAAATALGALLVVSAAWAAGTGRMPALWRAVVEKLAPPPLHSPVAMPAVRSDVTVLQPAPPLVPEAVVVPPIVAEAPRARPAPTSRGDSRSPSRSQATVPASDPPAQPDTDEQLFKAASQKHFIARDPLAALAGWDAYLAAAPTGRYALEATYNRALCLVRLGRRADAIAALRPFADGAHGDYRRRDASRLIEALAAEARP